MRSRLLRCPNGTAGTAAAARATAAPAATAAVREGATPTAGRLRPATAFRASTTGRCCAGFHTEGAAVRGLVVAGQSDDVSETQRHRVGASYRYLYKSAGPVHVGSVQDVTREASNVEKRVRVRTSVGPSCVPTLEILAISLVSVRSPPFTPASWAGVMRFDVISTLRARVAANGMRAGRCTDSGVERFAWRSEDDVRCCTVRPRVRRALRTPGHRRDCRFSLDSARRHPMPAV